MNDFDTAPRFLFDDGILHVSFLLTEMRIRWLPQPLAEEKDRRGRWTECWPEFRLLAPATAADAGDCDPGSGAKREAFAAFRQTIPHELCSLVESFDSHQWSFLKLLADSPAVRDLAATNPVLAYALANNAQLRDVPTAAGEDLALMHSHARHREILDWLGFPGTQATANLFCKIMPQAASPSALRRLRLALRSHGEAVLKRLAHQKRVNVGVLELVLPPKSIALVTPRLLAEVARDGAEAVPGETAEQVLHAVEMLEEIKSARTIGPFHSMAGVRTAVEEVDHEYRPVHEAQEAARQAAEQVRRERRATLRRVAVSKRPESFPWPPPPIPGTAAIVPISSYAMLCEEGEQQENCVASYWRDIIRKRVYVYRVLAPERATLSVMRRSDGFWTTSEVKAWRNHAVYAETNSMISRWIYSHSLSA